MSLAPGTTLGPYQIAASLGTGGMGEVYRAHDPRLGRDVALKVLPADMASDPSRLERFTREARTIAALNHPHIVTIHSTEEADGIRFLTMELVEGQSLDALIPPSGLPVAQFLDLALPLADALTAAHQKQITHRDLKPANVMVASDGRVKVLDFGLASAPANHLRQGYGGQEAGAHIGDVGPGFSPADLVTSPQVTTPGMVIGTMPYMSPEQVEGKTLDHRTDLFSLGVIFHEMLTGSRPFTGDSSAQLMSSILRDTPPRTSELRADVPEGLSRLIHRCLEKRVDDRVQTARDIFNELKHAQRQLESGVTDRSDARAPDSSAGLSTETFVVTVLPFASGARGGDASDLADGLTQGITVGLSRFSYLRVVQREASLDSVKTGFVLHGSVRVSGAVVRVVAQLTGAATGQHLWADTYDRRLDRSSIFDLQDELTEKIVATIADVNGALVRAMAVAVRTKPAASLSPSEAVIRALAYFSLISPEEHAELRTALERAVERAPNYADAWSALAFAYSEEYGQGYNARSRAIERAQSAIRRALELDSSNQLAYFTLGRLAFFARDRSALRAATDKLIALNPLAPHIISFLGMATAYTGDWEAGLALCERAMMLNPHHSGIYRMPFVIDAYRRRDYQGALEILDRVNMPSFPMTAMARAAIYAQLGRMDEALVVWREAEARNQGYSARIHDELTKWFAPELVAHIDEAVEKIRRRATGPSSGSAPAAAGASIAVLPFADLSAEKNQDWFCDGIAEEVLNALTQLPGLRVAARTSAFSFRDRGGDLRGIAEKLGVATVLQGSVRRAGDRIRVTVQLVDVGNGFQLWSDRYDRELKDIFDVQDEIARTVADRLKVTLTLGADERLVTKVTGNLESYELLLRGRTLLTRRGRAILDAQTCFERAAALDPGLAEAHALLGDSYRLIGLYGIAPTAEMMPKARAAAERALAIDANQVEALATLANITAVYDWDVRAGLALSERALACDPNHVPTLAERSIVPLMLASPSTAIVESARFSVRRARELDPLSAWAAAVECFSLHMSHRSADAVAAAHQAVALDASNFTAHWVMVWTLSAAGRHDEALAAAEQALAMSARNPRILTEVAAIHAARGDRGAVAAIDEELRERARVGFVGRAEQGAVAAAAGRMTEALELVQQALTARDSYLSFWKLPAWTPLRQNPEGAALLESAGFTRLNAR